LTPPKATPKLPWTLSGRAGSAAWRELSARGGGCVAALARAGDRACVDASDVFRVIAGLMYKADLGYVRKIGIVIQQEPEEVFEIFNLCFSRSNSLVIAILLLSSRGLSKSASSAPLAAGKGAAAEPGTECVLTGILCRELYVTLLYPPIAPGINSCPDNSFKNAEHRRYYSRPLGLVMTRRCAYSQGLGSGHGPGKYGHLRAAQPLPADSVFSSLRKGVQEISFPAKLCVRDTQCPKGGLWWRDASIGVST